MVCARRRQCTIPLLLLIDGLFLNSLPQAFIITWQVEMVIDQSTG